ncbi:kinase-like domain-containing protein [Pavlovales sp. CCMP2436]|nr:kinase-like domain-containing protein [Pavlovales sp. CCMP2436]
MATGSMRVWNGYKESLGVPLYIPAGEPAAPGYPKPKPKPKPKSKPKPTFKPKPTLKPKFRSKRKRSRPVPVPASTPDAHLICKKQLDEYNGAVQLKDEIEIQYHLDHDNVIKNYGFFYDEEHVYLIFQYMPGGDMYTTFCGTLNYLATEMVVDAAFNHSIDVYSLGVFMYECLVGKAPFERASHDATREQIVFPASLEMVDDAKELLQRNLV